MKKILLVEDDPFLVDIYQKKLKDSGFEVDVAENGEKALEILKDKNFDLMILDIVLPKIDGWKVLEEIIEMKKEKNDLEKMKIVIWSNLGEKRRYQKRSIFGRHFVFNKSKFYS
jgi:DNA-binding response OmpR family regulator